MDGWAGRIRSVLGWVGEVCGWRSSRSLPVGGSGGFTRLPRLTLSALFSHHFILLGYLYGVSPPDNDQVKEIRCIVMVPQVRGFDV